MTLLDLIRERKPDESAGRSAISESHERREGLLQMHDARTGQIGPEGIGLGRGEHFEMSGGFRGCLSEEARGFP